MGDVIVYWVMHHMLETLLLANKLDIVRALLVTSIMLTEVITGVKAIIAV